MHVGTVGVWGNRAGAVEMYPNPARNEVVVEGVRGCEVAIYDMVGQVLLEQKIISDKQVIDIRSLRKGMYFVEITDGETGERLVRKLVKD